MLTGNRYLDDLEKTDLLTPTVRLLSFCSDIVKEIFQGLRYGYFPVLPCAIITMVLAGALHWHWDYYFFARLGIKLLYPKHHLLFPVYKYAFLTMGIWIWGIKQVGARRRKQSYLDNVFESCGLKNGQGKYPQFIIDVPFDGNVRRLKVTREYLPHSAFVKAKTTFEGAMGVYVREFREQRRAGTEEIFYSTEPESDCFTLEDVAPLKPNEFIVGRRNGVTYYGDLRDTPHLLIAGETGGGKSTFLRQLITGLYFNDPKLQFTLIDLKAGLEFFLFKYVSRINVLTDLDKAIVAIGNLESEMNRRFRLLESKECRDLEGYSESNGEKPPRHVVVIDEVAEFFLPGNTTGSEITKARATINRIARQGRAIGIHLVVATQRPDSRSLDPQIKANLNGVLCFGMVNDTSSISVLGNGKATELPNIPGRAIWKVGNVLAEIQTPLMEEETAKQLLAPHKVVTLVKPAENTSDRFEPV